VSKALNEPCQTEGNPFEFARVLRAFVECSGPIQNIVLEMAEIVSDEESDEDDRAVASDAMMEALFPSRTTDVLRHYREILRAPCDAGAADELRTEQEDFATRVRRLMKEKGITQDDLAKAADIGRPAVSNLLTRRCRPQRRTVDKFAMALGATPAELWPEYVNTTP
jgi:lambda repressor-like predicted transcriptional regulator